MDKPLQSTLVGLTLLEGDVDDCKPTGGYVYTLVGAANSWKFEETKQP